MIRNEKAAGGLRPRQAADKFNFRDNSTPAEIVLQRLDSVKQTAPGKWLAKCPAHDDRSPSLSVRETDEGKVLLKCWAGCSAVEVVGALGLNLSDLFPRAESTGAPEKRVRAPRHGRELIPLLVQEGVILALAFRSLAAGKPLSDEDKHRALRAEGAVMGIWAEVRP